MTTAPASIIQSSSRYSLRRAQEADAAAVAALMDLPLVYANTMQLPFASTTTWAERLKTSANPPHLVLVAPLDGRIAGMAGIHPVNPSPRCQHARSLGITVHPDHWGTGLAPLLMQTLIDTAERWMGVSRIELTVFADNQRAQRLYERFGFEREGLLRQHVLRDGVLVDTVAMARLKP